MIRLRGHHLLCIQGFQGYGYSNEFRENMTRIHSKIMKNQENIELVKGPDDLCEHCPNLINNQCKNPDEDKNILSMDKIVLDKILKKENKTEFRPSELFEIVNDSFKTEKDLEDMCIGCIWFSKCLWANQISKK